VSYPAIQFNYLTAREDQAVQLAAIRLVRRIAAQQPLADMVEREQMPGAALIGDDELVDYARASGTTLHHPVGTCRMGSDDAAVVDSQLRVRGVRALRVVDASIMPRLVSGNTNAPVIMIAEKAADDILAAARTAVAA
jgi:choline dehydrogenase